MKLSILIVATVGVILFGNGADARRLTAMRRGIADLTQEEFEQRISLTKQYNAANSKLIELIKSQEPGEEQEELRLMRETVSVSATLMKLEGTLSQTLDGDGNLWSAQRELDLTVTCLKGMAKAFSLENTVLTDPREQAQRDMTEYYLMLNALNPWGELVRRAVQRLGSDLYSGGSEAQIMSEGIAGQTQALAILAGSYGQELSQEQRDEMLVTSMRQLVEAAAKLYEREGQLFL